MTLSLRCRLAKEKRIHSLTAASLERRGAAPFPHALGAFLPDVSRTADDDTDCPFGRYQNPPHGNLIQYTWQSRPSRESDRICALGGCMQHVETRGTACIAQPSAGSLEGPVVKTMPPSSLLCQCLGHARRSSPVHTARTHWKPQACLLGRACTSGLTSSFTCLVSCPCSCSRSGACACACALCLSMYGFVPCHVSRSQWPCRQRTMGWHEHWDALCRGINSSSTRQHWTIDVRVDHPSTISLTARARLVVLRPCPSQKWPCHLQPGERKPRNTRPILCLLPSATHPGATRRQDTPCTTPAVHDDLFVSSSSIAGPQLKHILPVLRGR